MILVYKRLHPGLCPIREQVAQSLTHIPLQKNESASCGLRINCCVWRGSVWVSTLNTSWWVLPNWTRRYPFNYTYYPLKTSRDSVTSRIRMQEWSPARSLMFPECACNIGATRTILTRESVAVWSMPKPHLQSLRETWQRHIQTVVHRSLKVTNRVGPTLVWYLIIINQ